MSEIVTAMKEAEQIAKGEIPAARLHHKGHVYVPLAEVERLRAALRNLVTACNAGRCVSMGAGGMTIEAQTRNSVINGVSAWAVCEAEEVLDGLDLGGQP